MSVQIDPQDVAIATLVATTVVGPVITRLLTKRTTDAAATKDEADAAQSLSVTVAALSDQLNALYARLAAAESRASAAESRLAAAEARNAISEAELARVRGEVAGLRVEVEQHSTNEKLLLEQLAAISGPVKPPATTSL